MIQVFYDKINTLFDGLEDDQKAEIFRQLSKKISDEGIKVGLRAAQAISAQQVPPSNPAPKKKWGGKSKGLLYQMVKGFDPKAKGASMLISGGLPQLDHTSIAYGEVVKIQHGRKPNAKYFLCVKTAGKSDWKFFGSSGDTVTEMEKIHEDYFENWGDMSDFCEKHFNSSTP